MLDLARGVQAIEQRHHDVEDGHVRLELARKPDDLVPVGGFTDDIEAGGGEEKAQALSNDHMVIGEEDAYWHIRPERQDACRGRPADVQFPRWRHQRAAPFGHPRRGRP